jgi:hypothetical protein
MFSQLNEPSFLPLDDSRTQKAGRREFCRFLTRKNAAAARKTETSTSTPSDCRRRRCRVIDKKYGGCDEALLI